MDSILEHMHLLLGTEMGCHVHKRLKELNLLLPMEDKAVRSSILKAISNPHGSNVREDP